MPADEAPRSTNPPPEAAVPTAQIAVANTLAQAGPSGFRGIADLVPLVLIAAVFYFMILRPQFRKQKELSEWLKGLKKGDEVVTAGGILGRITVLTDHVITIETQDKVKLRVLRSHISGRPPAGAASTQSAEASGPVAEAPNSR